jgi:hypothetical protein
MMIDLHGYSMPIARAAVRAALDMLRAEAVADREIKPTGVWQLSVEY